MFLIDSFQQAFGLLNQPIKTRHAGHSSVGILVNGLCIEVRRGSQRLFDIPDPHIWNSVQEWLAATPTLAYDLLQRTFPAHWTLDQLWMTQWHEVSTLSEISYDGYGNVQYAISGAPTILVQEMENGTLVPLYMSLETGSMYVNGAIFTSFAEAPFGIAQVWRAESGVYYRVA